MGRTLRILTGSLLLLLGLAGLVLPILQGWLFLGLGALVLSRDVPFFARVVHRIENRFPAVGRSICRLKKHIPGMSCPRTGPIELPPPKDTEL